ncbi:MAG: type 4a pilus biogenesis protein PilO [Myxococcales bacterium]|nr:type 4a pilus biogenesis protein PilO [Myxococcales bacterium]
MASESPIAKLAAKPLNYQLGVLVACIVVICGLYYQFFYSSLDEELVSSKSRYTRLENDNKKAKKREEEYKKLVKDKVELERTLSSNQVSLPATAALPSFSGHLQRQAAVAGVSFKKWDRLPEVAATGYVKVPVSVQVTGNFQQVLKYFYLLSKTKRIITIEDFSLTPEKNDSDDVLLKAIFRATTFRQEDGAVPKKKDAKKAVLANPKDAKAKKESQVEAVTGGKTDESGNPVPASSGVDRLKNPGAK